ESLDGDPLAGEPAFEAAALDVGGGPERLADGGLRAAGRRLARCRDAALADRLAGDAGERVDLVRREGVVGVGDPGHLLLAGAEVGRRDVDAWADEILAHQLGGVA